ncbi:MAG: hypothetical protein GX102_07655 [Porphyromonadaceae bacterium]|nr:hypothetical protein [Porphyromonadaceae bacterium]
MKKTTFLKMMLLAVVMLVGSVSWAQESIIYSTGFESIDEFTAGTVYNNTTVAFTGAEGKQWGTYYGTPSTTSAITDAQSMQMRWYTAAPNNFGYTFTNFDLPKATKVIFKAKNTAGINVIVSFSTDGGGTYQGEETINLSTSATEYTYTISPTGEFANVRIKFTMTFETAPSGTSRLYIDDVAVYGITGGAIPTATPTFSPEGGAYITPQDVSLSSATAGASIYYTTDGTDPNNTGNGTLYAGTPINVSTTTTIKAIAYADGLEPSSISTATYTFPIEVATIADLRAVSLPSTNLYKLTGEAIITLMTSSRNAKYIQDATGGILIDDAGGVITSTYNVGDGITGILGTLGEFRGMIQFTPYQDTGAASSTGNTVAPQVLTLAQLSNDYQAKLIQINNVTIEETGTFAVNTNYTLTDASGSGVMRLQYSDLPLVGTSIPTTAQDIIGVLLTYNTTQQLVPISMSPSSFTGLSTLKSAAHAWTAQGQIMVNASVGEMIEVFTMTGQKIVSRLAEDGINTINATAKGVLIVKTGNRVSKVIL